MIESIINSINRFVATIDIGNQEILGIARIHDLDNETYPAIYVDGNEWDKVSLDDAYDLTVYHRVLGIEEDENEDLDFRSSLDDSISEVYEMTMFVGMKKEYDYDKAVEIKNLIPGKLDVSGVAVAYITRGAIETDEDEIINDEFGVTDYTKYKSDYNIFKINYTIELNNC